MAQLGYERSFFVRANRNRLVSFASNSLVVFLTLLGASAQGQLADPSEPGPYAVSAGEYFLANGSGRLFEDYTGSHILHAGVYFPTILKNTLPNTTSEKFPLILLGHGNAYYCVDGTSFPCDKETHQVPNHEDFDYVAQSLASHGYIVVSFSSSWNTGNQIRFGIQRHLNLWNQLELAGGDNPSGLNANSAWELKGDTERRVNFEPTWFFGRVDMSKVGLAGHSMTGAEVAQYWGCIDSVSDASESGPCDDVIGFSAGLTPVAPDDIRALLLIDPVFSHTQAYEGLPAVRGVPTAVADLRGSHGWAASVVNASVPGPSGTEPLYSFSRFSSPNYFPLTLGHYGLLATASDRWRQPSEPQLLFGKYFSAFFRTHVGSEPEMKGYLTGHVLPDPVGVAGDVQIAYTPAWNEVHLASPLSGTECSASPGEDHHGAHCLFPGEILEADLCSDALCTAGGEPTSALDFFDLNFRATARAETGSTPEVVATLYSLAGNGEQLEDTLSVPVPFGEMDNYEVDDTTLTIAIPLSEFEQQGANLSQVVGVSVQYLDPSGSDSELVVRDVMLSHNFDLDGDENLDWEDNCPDVPNPGQQDSDDDGLGNACDSADNCPYVVNSDQMDSDGDGRGDACDNCVDLVNASQGDADLDGYGNACDWDVNNDGAAGLDDVVLILRSVGTGAPAMDLNEDGGVGFDDVFVALGHYNEPPGESGLSCARANGISAPCYSVEDPGMDTDGDGISNGIDNCVVTPNPGQADADGDEVGDECDNCLDQANSLQMDWNRDGYGNSCDLTHLSLQEVKEAEFNRVGYDGYIPRLDLNEDGLINRVGTSPPGSPTGQLNLHCYFTWYPEPLFREECPRGSYSSTKLDALHMDSIDVLPGELGDSGLPCASWLDSAAGSPGNTWDEGGDCYVLDGRFDTDADGARNSDDNCPTIGNPSQADLNGDGVGDACESG